MVLSLRQYLLFGFGIVLALFIATALYVNYETRGLRVVEERLLGNRLPTVLAGERLMDGMHMSLAGLRGYMILGADPEKGEKLKAERAAGWVKIDAAIKEYESLSTDWEEENLQRLAQVKVLIEEMRKVQQKVEDISQTPENIPSLHLLLTDAAPTADKVVAAITEVINLESQLEATPDRKLLLKMMADSRSSFALAMASMRAYLLSGDESFRKDFDVKWKLNYKRFRLLSAQSRVFDSQQKAAWKNYTKHLKAFSEFPPKLFELRSQEDWNKANYLLGTEAAPKAEKIKVLLNELAEHQTALAAVDTEKLYAEKMSLTMVNIVMTVVSVILGLSIAFFIGKMIELQLNLMVESAERVSKGDMTGPAIPYASIKDFNIVAEALNKTQVSLNTLINRIICSSQSLSSHSKQLEGLITDSQNIINKQQQDTNLIAEAVSGMGTAVKEVAGNTTEAAAAAENADNSSTEGHRVVAETVDNISELAKAIEDAASTINQLGEETNAVDTILASISGIADQTNLLALNAAIEAARAGEQGRGFAVVADEVRTLAGRTQESTIEIRTMLDKLKLGASNAVEVMEKGHHQAQGSVEKANAAKETLENITATVNTIKEMNTQIAEAAREQKVVATEMDDNINSITTGAQSIVQHTTKCISSSHEVADLSSQLAEGIAEFKVNQEQCNP